MAHVAWHGWHVRMAYPAGSAQKLSHRQRLAHVPATPAFSFSVTRSPGQREHRAVVPGFPRVTLLSTVLLLLMLADVIQHGFPARV